MSLIVLLFPSCLWLHNKYLLFRMPRNKAWSSSNSQAIHKMSSSSPSVPSSLLWTLAMPVDRNYPRISRLYSEVLPWWHPTFKSSRRLRCVLWAIRSLIYFLPNSSPYTQHVRNNLVINVIMIGDYEIFWVSFEQWVPQSATVQMHPSPFSSIVQFVIWTSPSLLLKTFHSFYHYWRTYFPVWVHHLKVNIPRRRPYSRLLLKSMVLSIMMIGFWK